MGLPARVVAAAATSARTATLAPPLHAAPPVAFIRASRVTRAASTSSALDAPSAPPRARRATLSALLAEKDARLAAAERELSARLAEKERLIEKESQLVAEKDKRLADVALRHAIVLAAALHAAAVAEGRLSVRSILQDAVASAWETCRPAGADVPGVGVRIAALIDRCPGFGAYLRVAALDNGVDSVGVLTEARKLYATLCSRPHGDAPGGSAALPSAVFDGLGRTALVAYAGVVHFSGRRLSLYDEVRAALPLVMRTERGCRATEAAIRASLPLVEERGAATVSATGAREE